VTSPAEHTPVYKQLIGYVKRGYAALNEEHQAEIRNFVQSCQHREGAYIDRAGNPDCYYSLFGVWLSLATGLSESLDKHKQFLRQANRKQENLADEFSILLIKHSVAADNFKKPSRFYLLKKMLFTKSHVSLFYRLFLFVLIVDAFYPGKLLYAAARGILVFISPPAGSPCSVRAAFITGRHVTGLDVKKEQKVLLDFFVHGKGFKSFADAGEVDLLSTAVALFALKTIEADLRMIAPDCLDLIQQNYSNGAFLAGNGDGVRDLEYTFYGLLALGILV
jgi:hypothetical protein